MKSKLPSKPAKRRITVTLPADMLARAEKIARKRNETLSSGVAKGLEEVLRADDPAQHGEELLRAFQKPFIGFSDEEMMILDGIILEPIPAGRRPASAG
jgi:hypothetical protein